MNEELGLIRINGNWEPKMFLKRRGDGTFIDVDRLWQHIHSDEYIEHLLDVGVNLSHIHFHKGYGLKAETASINEAKLWAKKLHAAGIKVGVYIGSTFFTETFQHSEYEQMITDNGVSGWNAAQYFRKHWCYNSPHAVKYFQEVIRVAIEEVKADVLHFDTAFALKLDQLCHCQYCMEKFKKFVTENIPAIANIAGFDDPTLLTPPPYGNHDYLANIDEMKEPGLIAWTLFHAQAGYEALEATCKYARSIKDDILIFYNGCQLAGNTRFSRPDMALEKLSLVDMSCTEDCNENPVKVTADGMPVSRFRTYKAGNNSQTSFCYYTVTNGEDSRLMLAESAAFNYNSLGFIDIAMQQNHQLNQLEAIEFVQYLIEHESLFTNQTPWHNIAVLRHHETLLLNQYPCALTPYVVEQALFEAHLPFSIINSQDINRETLAKFELLILPDTKSLSDAELTVIEAFVATGGRLIAIGNSATATEFNQYRETWGLADIFNRDTSPFTPVIKYDEVAVSTTVTEQVAVDQQQLLVDYKQGQAAYLPALEFAIPANHHELNRFGGFKWYYHPYWQPAKNIDLLIKAVEQLTADKFNVTTNLPRQVGVEYYRTAAGYRIHLVNYNHPATVSGAELVIHNQFTESTVYRVEYLTEAGNSTKQISANGNRLVIPITDFSLILTIEIK